VQINKFLDILNEIRPFELKDSWDNSGLIIGDKRSEVGHIYLSLDIEEVMFARVTYFQHSRRQKSDLGDRTTELHP